jgi:hypothetical protein
MLREREGKCVYADVHVYTTHMYSCGTEKRIVFGYDAVSPFAVISPF